MKHLLSLLVILLPIMVFAGGLPYPCQAVVKNIDCQGPSLSFELTITANNQPITINGSNYIGISTDPNDDKVFNNLGLIASGDLGQFNENFELDDQLFSPSFADENDCSDFLGASTLYLTLSGNNFDLESPGGFNECNNLPLKINYEVSPSPEDLPTFGQWSLILFGLGILTLAVFLMVRNGKTLKI